MFCELIFKMMIFLSFHYIPIITNNYLFLMISVFILSSLDFWFCKNYTGRYLLIF